MRNQTVLITTFLVLLISGCVHRTKQESMDMQCPRLITQAQALYSKQAKNRDKLIADQAANLITGAKIDREHREFIQCMDKASRAIKLLDPNAQLSVQYDN
jgi:hypothetical protein